MSSIEQQMMYAVQYVVLNQKTPQATALWLSQQVNNDLQASGELSPQK